MSKNTSLPKSLSSDMLQQSSIEQAAYENQNSEEAFQRFLMSLEMSKSSQPAREKNVDIFVLDTEKTREILSNVPVFIGGKEINNEDYRRLSHKGSEYFDKREYFKAVICLEKIVAWAIENDTSDLSYLSYLGRSYYKLGYYSLAKSVLRISMRQSSIDENALFDLGMIYCQGSAGHNSLKAGIACFELAVERGNVEAAEKLAEYKAILHSEVAKRRMVNINQLEAVLNAELIKEAARQQEVMQNIIQAHSILMQERQKIEQLITSENQEVITPIEMYNKAVTKLKSNETADIQDAITLLRVAADNKNFDALSLLGDLYDEDIIVPRDPIKAGEFYKEGQKEGDITAANKLTKLTIKESNTAIDILKGETKKAMSSATEDMKGFWNEIEQNMNTLQSLCKISYNIPRTGLLLVDPKTPEKIQDIIEHLRKEKSQVDRNNDAVNIIEAMITKFESEKKLSENAAEDHKNNITKSKLEKELVDTSGILDRAFDSESKKCATLKHKTLGRKHQHIEFNQIELLTNKCEEIISVIRKQEINQSIIEKARRYDNEPSKQKYFITFSERIFSVHTSIVSGQGGEIVGSGDSKYNAVATVTNSAGGVAGTAAPIVPIITGFISWAITKMGNTKQRKGWNLITNKLGREPSEVSKLATLTADLLLETEFVDLESFVESTKNLELFFTAGKRAAIYSSSIPSLDSEDKKYPKDMQTLLEDVTYISSKHSDMLMNGMKTEEIPITFRDELSNKAIKCAEYVIEKSKIVSAVPKKVELSEKEKELITLSEKAESSARKEVTHNEATSKLSNSPKLDTSLKPIEAAQGLSPVKESRESLSKKTFLSDLMKSRQAVAEPQVTMLAALTNNKVATGGSMGVSGQQTH